jgi:integrase
MPIRKEKGRLRFQFNRVIGNRRIRASKLLPKGWTAKQADEFDRKETARLYALGSGQQQEPLIEDAVLLYIENRLPELISAKEVQRQLAADFHIYQGKTFDQMPEIVSEIKKSPLSPRSKEARIAYIRAACRYAFKHFNMGKHLPGVGLAMPTVNNERQVYVDRKGMLEVVRACSRSSRPYIRIAFYSGMRLSELFKAELREDIILLRTTKNGTPRAIPIHPKIRSAVEKYLPPKIARSTIQSHHLKAKRQAGYDEITFHTLRHSAASEMVNNDVDLYAVGAVLGHKDPRSTKRYAHLATKTLKAAIHKIGRKMPTSEAA